MEEEKQVNGVTVAVQRCDHCGKEPTEREVSSAVRMAQKQRECSQWRCAYCGKPIKATKYTVQHYSEGWLACETQIEPSLTIDRMYGPGGPPIHDHNGLHQECALKAMPFINGYERE